VKKGIRILILEDEAADAELLRRELRRGHIAFSSKCVATRQDFVESLQTFAPDLILSDCTLPGFDGLSALAVAREERPDVPFIFVSGTLDDQMAVESLKQGATDYILKDRRARLVPAVQRALRETEERRKRRRVVRVLRENEERFRVMVEGLKDYAIYMLDTEGRVTSWNTGARRLFGYSLEEIIGQHFSRFYLSEESQHRRPEQTLRTAAEQGRVEEEAWRVRKDGSRFWANSIVTTLREKRAQLDGFACITRDMTERRQAEEALERIQERQSFLLRSMPVTLYTARPPPDYSTTWVSENVHRVTGYSTEEMVNSRTFWIDRLHPDDRERVLKGFEAIFDRRSVVAEYRWKYADGAYRWLRDEGVLSCDEHGEFKEIIGSWLDITERKQREADLRKSIQLYRTVADNIPNGVVATFDKDLRYIMVNGSQVVDAMGLRREQVEGKTLFEVFPPETCAEIEPIYRAALAGAALDTELPFGNRLYFVQGLPLRNGQGEIHAGIALALDITERRLVADQVRKLNEELEKRVAGRTAQLEAANKELEAFSYTVSHDLRAPLRAMHGLANALLEDCAEQLDAAGKDYGRRIMAAANRMDTLIQGLLSYSRLSRVDLEPRTVALESVVRTALCQLEAEIQERDALITVETPLPRVMGDPLALVQILSNLLLNAVKFVAPEVKPEVRVRAETKGDRVRLWVEDNGIGIAPEHQQRVFNVFERLHGIETYPGTGIGLAIVRKGIERLGGRVGLESAPGRGSRFWIEVVKGRELQ
jgi:PAS domain S-box-containing protein